jgi:hypothetical protein
MWRVEKRFFLVPSQHHSKNALIFVGSPRRETKYGEEKEMMTGRTREN